MKYDKFMRRGAVDGHNSTLGVFALSVLVIALLTITGSGASAIVTTPISPKLVSPGSPDRTGAEITTLTPALKWEEVFDAELYSVYVRKFPFTENDVVFKAESVSKPSVTVPDGFLADGEKYRWYARAFNKAGWSDKSQVFSFVVSLLTDDSAPMLVAPGSAGKTVPVIMTTSPTFRWKPVPNAKRYGLYISKYPSGNGHFVYKNESITDSSFTLPKGFLSPGKTYRWNVKSQTKTGGGNPSQRFYFTVKALQEMTPGTTSQATATPDQKKPVGETSAYPILPSDVIVEGESPRSNSFVARLYTPHHVSADAGSRMDQISPPLLPSSTQKQLAQREMPPGTPSRPGAEPSPPSPQPTAPVAPAPPPPPRPNGQISVPSAGSMVQMQFDNIELRDLIKFVSNIMGKNFIFDDNVVKGRVTILSPKSLTRDEVFRAFESVLNYYGFSIVSSPEAYKVVKSADAKGTCHRESR